MRLPGVLVIAVLMMLASVLQDRTVEGSPQEHPEQFYYPYVRPTVLPNSAAPKFYPDNHDFTDYSMHFTRSDPSSRNSGAEPPPSGPYFAHELKSYYHNPAQQKAVYQTSWNMIDSDGNDYTPYQRPSSHVVNNPSLAQFASNEDELAVWQQLQQRPNSIVRKPITKKPIRKKQQQQHNKNKRPVQPGFQKHPNSIDKVSDIAGPQSIASAYPNGVMGTLSLMAGLVWYMVNKSATPVIKMRSSSTSSREQDSEDSTMEIPAKFNELVNHWWDSLKQTDCQQRAVCELVTEYPFISKATRWSKSVFRMPMMQKTIKTLREENGSSLNLKSLSKMAMLFRAASHAERGVDCSAFFPDCPLIFRAEDRDRRR